MFSTVALSARLLTPAAILIALLPLFASAFLNAANAEAHAGRALYLEHCAACHGVDLEGQPDWRRSGADGVYPAPPHYESGHTWHHDDAMLIDYITRGGQAVLNEQGVPFNSGMPGFGSVLDEQEIEAILDYIKSTWPDHIRDLQAQRSNAAAAD
jgi:mono/diheme cytochrome c family protein